jgi:hypothetical protein
MSRYLTFILILLIFVAFFFGIRIGKTIQTIDTPVKTIQKKVIVKPTLKLQNYSLKFCSFSFVLPDLYQVKLSSQSAVIKKNQQSLLIACSPALKKTTKTVVYKNLRTGSLVYIEEDNSLYQTIKAGFAAEFQPLLTQ